MKNYGNCIWFCQKNMTNPDLSMDNINGLQYFVLNLIDLPSHDVNCPLRLLVCILRGSCLCDFVDLICWQLCKSRQRWRLYTTSIHTGRAFTISLTYFLYYSSWFHFMNTIWKHFMKYFFKNKTLWEWLEQPVRGSFWRCFFCHGPPYIDRLKT